MALIGWIGYKKINFCWIIFFSISIMFFYGCWIGPHGAPSAIQVFCLFQNFHNTHHFHFLYISWRKGHPCKTFLCIYWSLEIGGTILIVYFWYGKRCYFKVIKNGGWWGGGWSEMRLSTFIAFCLFQIFKGPITFIF